MLLAKPTEIAKGSAASFTLDKTGLSQLAVVAADSYFSDVANWFEIALIYKSPFGGKEFVRFDAAYLNPTSEFMVSARARGGFDLETLIIYDFDNGYLKLSREDIGVSDFDIAFAPQALPFLSDWVSMSKIFSLSEDYVAS